MKDLGNKAIMSKNLRRIMSERGVSAKDLSKTLGFPYTTLLSWLKAENYPRIDKIEAMADYFGILKSDLIEDKEIEAKKEKTDVAVDIVIRLGADAKFCEAVKLLYQLDDEKLDGVSAMLRSLVK